MGEVPGVHGEAVDLEAGRHRVVVREVPRRLQDLGLPDGVVDVRRGVLAAEEHPVRPRGHPLAAVPRARHLELERRREWRLRAEGPHGLAPEHEGLVPVLYGDRGAGGYPHGQGGHSGLPLLGRAQGGAHGPATTAALQAHGPGASAAEGLVVAEPPQLLAELIVGPGVRVGLARILRQAQAPAVLGRDAEVRVPQQEHGAVRADGVDHLVHLTLELHLRPDSLDLLEPLLEALQAVLQAALLLRAQVAVDEAEAPVEEHESAGHHALGT
mmetsp:Transcript_96106/g.299331  ORF Transcript_96106/g.299331 Transcript_96106/m.299331 type:complete len:270 (-) Transcript_96106:624-1433(-)